MGSAQYLGALGLDLARRYHIEGNDLYVNVLLAPWEAALGAVVPVDLPEGRIHVSIPEGARPGRPLRVRGKGLPGDPPGDLYLDITIVAPPADTPRAQELYQALAAETRFDPRKMSRHDPGVAE